MTDAKKRKLQVLLAKGIRQGSLLNWEAQLPADKVNHYSNLVSRKFERCLIIHVVNDKKRKLEEVIVEKQARIQKTGSFIT